MALELLGLRFLAPRFGASTYVWGSLLGTVMAALAMGYLLGGRLADRRPRPTCVYVALMAAAIYLVPIPFITAPLLDACERLGSAVGPLVATVLLLGPPVLALGSVSPFLVKLLCADDRLGSGAGLVFAVSTAGALAGTFITAFWLIPAVGSRATLRLWIVALVLPAAAGLVARNRAYVGLLAVLPVLLIPPRGGDALVLYRGESAYNSLVVEERAGSRRLLLNDERFGIHSVSRRDQVLTGLYYDAFYVAPILAGGTDVLVLGMAGGTTVRGYRTLFPGARLTAVEIDPRVVEVARRYFWLADGPDLDVHVRDARPFLSESASRFDVIEADLFAGGVYAPFYVVTREFFDLARRWRGADGVIVVNALAVGGDDDVARAVAATMATVFPSVFELPLRNQRLLFGFAARVDLQALRSRLDDTDIAGLGDVLRTARARLRDATHSADAPILTDDWAPIEQLTDRMMKRRPPGKDAVPSASR